MKVTHRLEVVAVCPVDKAGDVYAVTIRCRRVLFVEDILKAVKELNAKPTTQEEFTQGLHRKLAAEVETAGYHSGVYTTVICGGE